MWQIEAEKKMCKDGEASTVSNQLECQQLCEQTLRPKCVGISFKGTGCRTCHNDYLISWFLSDFYRRPGKSFFRYKDQFSSLTIDIDIEKYGNNTGRNCFSKMLKRASMGLKIRVKQELTVEDRVSNVVLRYDTY